MATALRPQEQEFLDDLPQEHSLELVPELRCVLTTARTLPFYDDSPALALLTYKVACELGKRGVYVEALPLLREALAELAVVLGPDHEHTLNAAQGLGVCLVDLGQTAEALPLLDGLVAHHTQLKGEESKEALTLLQSIALARLQLGDLAGAETLLRQGEAALARLAVGAGLSSRSPPPGLEDTWTSLISKLATLSWRREQREDTEALLRESLAILADTPASAERRHWMSTLGAQRGSVLREGGDLLGAEKLLRQLLPKVAGTSDYGAVANNLGAVLQQRGLVTESRRFLNIGQHADSDSYGAAHERAQASRLERHKLTAILHTCAQCGPVAKSMIMKVCSACSAARYCSPACQRLHWALHRPECRRIKAENEAVLASSEAGPAGA